MAALEGVRFVDVDATLAQTFRDYARTFGAVHGETGITHDETTGFDPAAEPAVLALDEFDAPHGAASVMLAGDGHARFRVLHALDPALYAPLIEAVAARVPETVSQVCLFLPEHAGVIEETLTASGFAKSRRAYVMLHPSPTAATEPELPAETTLSVALPTASSDWTFIVNAAFHGYPGHTDLTLERAAELLARPEVIKGGTLIAYRGGSPAGVVMTAADPKNPFEAEIEMLAVLPADQHVGLGRALLRAALLAAGHDGRSSVILSVSTFSKRAMAMYLDAGFNVHDVRVCWELRRP